jgi:proteasome lid subunit RPN8/RPN11
MKLILPAALETEIARQARAAFPRECCGLIAGARVGDDFHATRIHPGRNLAQAPDRFEIDPMDHIAAVKSARTRGATIIGCYHSHPNGEARPSRHDRSCAGEDDFLWLIAATDGVQCRIEGFVYRDGDFESVSPGSGMGADLVTSSWNERN